MLELPEQFSEIFYPSCLYNRGGNDEEGEI